METLKSHKKSLFIDVILKALSKRNMSLIKTMNNFSNFVFFYIIIGYI